MGPLPILTPGRLPARGVPGPHRAFVGDVWVDGLYDAPDDSGGLLLHAVYFESGARSRPHTHDGEQILHFVSGAGFVHVAGAEEQHVPAGSAVVVPPDVVHMHGALAGESCMHVAVLQVGRKSTWTFDELPDGWERWCLP